MKHSRNFALVCMVAFAVAIFTLAVSAFEPSPVAKKAEAVKAVKSIPTVQVSTNSAVDAAITVNVLTLSRGVQPEYLAFGPSLVNKELPKTVNTIGRISPAHGPPITDKSAAGASKRTIERHTRTDTVLLL